MKNIFTKALCLAAVGAALLTSCQNKYNSTITLKNAVDSTSYGLGCAQAMGFMQSMQRMPFDTVDFAKLAAAFSASELNERFIDYMKGQFDTLAIEPFKYGFHSALANGGKGQIDDEELNTYLQARFSAIKERKDAERKAVAAKSLAEGLNFLAENAKKEGVIVTESGLQYEVVKMGEGEKPAADSRVKVLYTGKLIDGTVFDSTANNNDEPATLSLNGVIKAWTEALQLMPVGSKFTIYAPSELAYGERGAGDKIPGNSALIFDIELVEIVK